MCGNLNINQIGIKLTTKKTKIFSLDFFSARTFYEVKEKKLFGSEIMLLNIPPNAKSRLNFLCFASPIQGIRIRQSPP